MARHPVSAKEVKVVSSVNEHQAWIGENYDSTRLLLLGESAYSWHEENGDLRHPSLRHSIDLVEDVLHDFASAPAFIRMLSRALANEVDPSAELLRAVWQKVAFTNYVTGTVGEGPRQRPSPEMWNGAKEALPGLLAELRPRRAVVLGKTMWSKMPECEVRITDDVQGYRLPDGSLALCWALNHPSRGLSWRQLAAVVQFACERELRG